MSAQTQPVYLVSVDSTPQNAKDITGKVIKALEKDYSLVHVANCESIGTVKHVLTSLITPPGLLIISGGFFDEETEEIREIAKRMLPGIELIAIPNDLKELDREGGDGELIAYLKEQIEDSGVPKRG